MPEGLMPPLILELRAKAGEAISELKAAQDEVDKTAEKAESGGSRFSNAFNRAVPAARMITLATLAAGAAVVAYSVKAADEADVANGNLSIALKGAGYSFDSQRQKIEATDKSMENLGFTNAQTNQTLANLVIGIQNPTKAMAAMSLAANIARERGISLSAAGQLVMKAMEGQSRPLKQLGIDLPVVASNAEKLVTSQEALKAQTLAVAAAQDTYNSKTGHTAANLIALHAAQMKVKFDQDQLNNAQHAGTTIMDALNKRFADAGNVYAQTLTGRLDVLHAKVQDTAAAFGEHLEPVLIHAATDLASFGEWVLKTKDVLYPLAAVVGVVVVGAMAVYTAHLAIAAARTVAEFASMAAKAATWAASTIGRLVGVSAAQEEQTAATAAAGAEQGGIWEGLGVSIEEYAAAAAAAKVEVDTSVGGMGSSIAAFAAEQQAAMAAGDESTAESSAGIVRSIGTWVAAQARAAASAVASGARWVAQSAVQVGQWIATNAVRVASSVASTAVLVAGYVATGVAATAAYIAENAATLGIIAGIGLLVAAAVGVATHWKQVWGGIKHVFDDTVRFIREHVMLVAAIFGPFGIAIALVATHWKQIWGVVKSVIADAADVISDVVSGIVSVVSDAWDAVSSVTSDVWGVIKDYVTLQVDAVRDVISVVFDVIRDVVSTTMHTVSSVIDVVLDLIHGNWSAAWTTIESIPGKAITAMISTIQNAVSGFGSLLLSAGENIITGLVHGIESMAQAPLHAIEGIGKGVISAAKKILKIFSPSQEFHDLGVQITAGWANGIAAGTPAVISQVKSAANMVLSKAKSALSSLESAQASLVKSTTSSYLSAADVTGATGTGLNGTLTSQDVLANLSQQANALSTYRLQLVALRKEGLNSALYGQLVAAGVSGGSGTATALLAGGKSAITQADQYSASISSSATSIGTDVGAATYATAIAKALKTELADAQLVASVDVYLDGKKVQSNMVKTSQKRKARVGATGLT